MENPDSEPIPASFVAALRAITQWLTDAQVEYATIGGIAVSLLSQPRATQDIDAVIWTEDQLWQDLLDDGRKYGIEPRLSDALEFARRSRVLLLKHVPSGISLDISCGALEFERQMIERATVKQIGDISLKLPTLEDLIITKAVAQRGKDIADLESLFAIADTLDMEWIRFWTNQFFDALEAPEMRRNFESMVSRWKLQ